jgi:hypothetical protein
MDNHQKKQRAVDLVGCRDCGAEKGQPCGTKLIDGTVKEWLHAVRMRDAINVAVEIRLEDSSSNPECKPCSLSVKEGKKRDKRESRS